MLLCTRTRAPSTRLEMEIHLGRPGGDEEDLVFKDLVYNICSCILYCCIMYLLDYRCSVFMDENTVKVWCLI